MLLKQGGLFALMIFALIGALNYFVFTPLEIGRFLLISIPSIAFVKIGIFNLLKYLRIHLGGNKRNVVLIGESKNTKLLQDFFNNNPAYGYNVLSRFPNGNQNLLIDELCKLSSKRNLNEIYISLKELSNDNLTSLTKFAHDNFLIIKFIPDFNLVFKRKLQYQYYGITPILSFKEIALDDFTNKFFKRSFDVVLSILIFIVVLSWLTPLLALLIKLESKGPVFYKHSRNGLGYRPFNCYKFRSMKWRDFKDINQVSKNDSRVTRIGRFLRRTSLDELPQFYNVLLGEMSVVGPRPHMPKYNENYMARVERFMVRHLIKPGITGLAQISGYRGEVEKDSDIINRVRYDIFYMENWSLLMDIRIIAKTIVQIIKGDPKAY